MGKKQIAWSVNGGNGEHLLKTDLINIQLTPASGGWNVRVANAGYYVTLLRERFDGDIEDAKLYAVMRAQEVARRELMRLDLLR